MVNPSATALLATASIACIFAVAAAAATAAAVGIILVPLGGPIKAFGGVIALPTLRYCPPKSNKFIDAIASKAACIVSYSIKP